MLTNDYEGALLDLKKCIQLDSSNVSVYFNRARAEYWLKDYKDALADCNFVLISMPNDPNVLALRSSVQLPLGNKQATCDDYRKSVLYGAKRLQAAENYCNLK